MNGQGAEFVEIFLQEASERLQFLREYSGILQDAYPRAEDVERLFIAAHTLAGTSGSYGFALFSEISGKLAHIFQYAMNASISVNPIRASLIVRPSDSRPKVMRSRPTGSTMAP